MRLQAAMDHLTKLEVKHESTHDILLTFQKEFVNMLLQDLAFPDSGRLLQKLGPSMEGPSDSSLDDDYHGSPFNHVGIYVAGVGLMLLCAIWCISSVRSGLATRDVNATSVLPVLAQDERACDEILRSTLVAQRKHVILELFHTSQVTMVRNEVRGALELPHTVGVSPIAIYQTNLFD
jgi:hypothetical protein